MRRMLVEEEFINNNLSSHSGSKDPRIVLHSRLCTCKNNLSQERFCMISVGCTKVHFAVVNYKDDIESASMVAVISSFKKSS